MVKPTGWVVEMRHYIDDKLELSGKVTMKPFGRGRVSIGVRQNKVYWIVPFILVLGLVVLLVVTSQSAAPFIYTLF